MANADPAGIPPAITESRNKLNALLRYAGTSGGTLLTIMGVFSLLSPEQIVDVKQQIEIFNNSIVSAYGALTKMWIILGPVAIAFLAKAGWNSSTVQAMTSKLLGIATNTSNLAAAQAARVELVKAAASPAIGTQAIVNSALAADPATPANVVVSAAAASSIKTP